jgi:hypothetical protein
MNVPEKQIAFPGRFFVVWGYDFLVWGSNLVAEFPAKMGLAGNIRLSADVFPRQCGFGGFLTVI